MFTAWQRPVGVRGLCPSGVKALMRGAGLVKSTALAPLLLSS